MLWVVQRDTHFDLAEIHDAAEAVRRLLIVVVLPNAFLPFIDDSFDLPQVSIEEVDFSRRRLYPRASVYPRSPFIQASHDRYDTVY